MNRLKATNSVAFANRDIAPVSGTPQYATSGNPVGPVPPTIWPAYAWNMIQDEILAVILAAGLTPDDTNWAQLLQAIQTLTPALGQCRLSFVSGSQLKLSPYNGSYLTINGVPYEIPQAGITLANTGLVAATLYYVYAFMAGATMTLEASATTHATDATAANYGVEIKAGDSTRTLVGMIYTGAGTPGTFVAPAALNLQILNWFNRKQCAVATVASVATTASLTAVGVTSSIVSFLTWSDEAINLTCSGSGSNNTGGDGVVIAVLIDGGIFGTAPNATTGTTAFPFSASGAGNVTEGRHTAQAGAAAVTGGTASVNISITGIVRG